MACACNSGKSSKFNTEVTFKDGTKAVFGSRSEARIAAISKGGGATMKQVPKETHPITK